MRRLALGLLLAAAACTCAMYAHANDQVVSMRDMRFSLQRVIVPKGTRVLFVNEDPFAHSVFWAEEHAGFDLGTLLKGQPPRAVVFDRPGTFVVECAMHPAMTMTVDVQR